MSDEATGDGTTGDGASDVVRPDEAREGRRDRRGRPWWRADPVPVLPELSQIVRFAALTLIREKLTPPDPSAPVEGAARYFNSAFESCARVFAENQASGENRIQIERTWSAVSGHWEGKIRSQEEALNIRLPRYHENPASAYLIDAAASVAGRDAFDLVLSRVRQHYEVTNEVATSNPRPVMWAGSVLLALDAARQMAATAPDADRLGRGTFREFTNEGLAELVESAFEPLLRLARDSLVSAGALAIAPVAAATPSPAAL